LLRLGLLNRAKLAGISIFSSSRFSSQRSASAVVNAWARATLAACAQGHLDGPAVLLGRIRKADDQLLALARGLEAGIVVEPVGLLLFDTGILNPKQNP
jgi:hypothetical protein